MAKTKKATTKTKYKKAPQAPRRFKSAYMFFSTSKHKEIREDFGSRGLVEKTTNIAKLISVAWKALNPKDRGKWDELAIQDKARFEVEKSTYFGPWKVLVAAKGSPTIKDPNSPKRPMSAFLAYSHAKRAEVKKENLKMNNTEISRTLASMWKCAPQNEKKVFIDTEYKLLRQKYLAAITVWRENAKKVRTDQRRHREDIAMQTVAARGGPAAIHEEVAQRQNLEEQAHSYDGAYHSTGYYSHPPDRHHYGSPQDYYQPRYQYAAYPSYYPPPSITSMSYQQNQYHRHQRQRSPHQSDSRQQLELNPAAGPPSAEYYTTSSYGYPLPHAAAYRDQYQENGPYAAGGYHDPQTSHNATAHTNNASYRYAPGPPCDPAGGDPQGPMEVASLGKGAPTSPPHSEKGLEGAATASPNTIRDDSSNRDQSAPYYDESASRQHQQPGYVYSNQHTFATDDSSCFSPPRPRASKPKAYESR